ncbi:MAG: DUF1320 domain-containing protein [Pseudomonadota bacterium]
MAYADQSDIEELYGVDALYVADRDGDGEVDVAAVALALDLASAEIDAQLAARYTLPLGERYLILVPYAVDIALYRLALSRDVLSAEHRQRYDDAIEALEKLASGKTRLPLFGVDLPDSDPDGPDLGSGPQPIVSGGPEREFSREKMRGL